MNKNCLIVSHLCKQNLHFSEIPDFTDMSFKYDLKSSDLPTLKNKFGVNFSTEDNLFRQCFWVDCCIMFSFGILLCLVG